MFDGLRIAWIAYSSLRRDILSPIGSTDKYVEAVVRIRELTGEPVHWMQLKGLSPDCHVCPESADDDEKEAHANVIHYGDCFAGVVKHISGAPVRGRREWLLENPVPPEFKYQIPEVDVALIEGTCQIAAAYGVNEVLKLLYARNPRMGFIILDQDQAGSTSRSKLGKWHPDRDHRLVMASYDPVRRFPNQVMAVIPYLAKRMREPRLVPSPTACYIGNDYDRREAMLKYLRGPYFHHYGRIKKDFVPIVQEGGANFHGQFVPQRGRSIEDVYRHHGVGLNFLREVYNKNNLLTPRLSEITRAGVLCLMDGACRIARPIIGDWCSVSSAEEVVEKIRQLPQYPEFWQDRILRQQEAGSFYLSCERYVLALLTAAAYLKRGRLSTFIYNTYDDLLQAAGIPTWGTQCSYSKV